MDFLNIAFISKVNIAALNGSEGSGGNITPIKKVNDNQGNEYAYISGQAQRRYLKETLMQLGERITAVNEKGEPSFLELNDKIYSKNGDKFEDKKLMYESFCDLDLFGYMLPKGGRRWSPVKVSPMISIHPYKGEYDYLTRKQYIEDEGKKSGNIVQVEIDTMNFMRGNIILDADKIGKDINEYTYESKKMLDDSKIIERRNLFIDAVKFFNGGAKQARNLEDISPKFVVAVRQKTGNPFLLNSLNVDNENNLVIGPILEAITGNKEVIIDSSVSIGIASNIFANQDEVIKEFESEGINVTSVSKALDSLKK